MWSLIGILASIAVVLSWVPQVVRIVSTKRADDISMGLPLLLIVGSVLWMAYGMHLEDVIIITVNTVVMSFNVLIILLKRKYRTGKA